MRIVIRSKSEHLRLWLWAPYRLGSFFARKTVGQEYPWIIPLLASYKRCRRLMKGKPLIEVESDDATIRIFL